MFVQPDTVASAWMWHDHGTYRIGEERTAPAERDHSLRYRIVDEWPFREYADTGPNRARRVGTGAYVATLPGLGVAGGNVQVTAQEDLPAHYCKVASWWPDGDDLSVDVRCFDPDGTPSNSAFYLMFFKDSELGSSGPAKGYLWANQPTAASYAPSPYYQFNSRGETNHVTRTGTGQYDVVLPELSSRVDDLHKAGTVLVTAYGTDDARCVVRDWDWIGYGDVLAQVDCYDGTGGRVDARFSLAYMAAPGTLPALYAEDAVEAFYASVNAGGHTSAFEQSDSYGDGGIVTEMPRDGAYRVFLPGIASTGSMAHVTVAGGDNALCTVSRIVDRDVLTEIDVHCFDLEGNLRNTAFNLYYATDDAVLF